MNRIEKMIEVIPKVDVRIIDETLTRIGIANKKKKILYPSCYLYRNYEKFYIVHFKELFSLTRHSGYDNISQDDLNRKNSIICRLESWGLIETVNYEDLKDCNEFVYILPFKEKAKWNVQHKFNVNNLRVIE